MKMKSFALFALCPLLLLPARAAETVPLETLVQQALEKNPELKFYEAEIAAAKAGRKTAGVFANPELSTQLGYKGVHDKTGTLLGEGVAWSVSVAQTFEWPGRIGLRKAIANHDIQLAELGYAQFRAALAAKTRALAYNIFVAQEKSATAREVAGRFQALKDVLVQRDPAGLTPLLETRIIEANTLTLQRQASEAATTAQAAYLELNQLRGVAMDSKLAIAPANLSFRPAEALETLLTQARTNSFELRIRATELAQQGFKVNLTKNEKYPGITVGPYLSLERAGDRERGAGIAFSLPLPLWNKNTGNIEAAQARQMQAEVSLLVTQRDVERRVVESALVYETKLAAMSRWRPDSAQHFREAAELADRHYRLGAVPVSTYVELQKQYLEAITALLDTKKDALDAAQTLEQLTGLAIPLVITTEVKP
ncbi:MAG: TolC family protein [Verrucomicrobia bacterium]|nr:TolC family protein [Verrucomicrobiota bacterium]